MASAGARHHHPFHGAKIAVFRKADLLVYLRDDRPDIPFPATWDLPGGGREGEETPVECALREVQEEFGLQLDPDRVVAVRWYPGKSSTSPGSYFMALRHHDDLAMHISFGEEGQRWDLMPVAQFLTHACVP